MNFVVLDFETTGLTLHRQAPIRKQPRPIEFAAIKTDGYSILDEMEFICDPQIQIEDIITKITGIKQSDLYGKPTFPRFVNQIAEFLKGCDVVIAHNLSFDQAIMDYALKRDGKELADVMWPDIRVCTVEQTFPTYGYMPKLADLYEQLCGPYVQKHRALDDVKLLHEVCLKLGIYNAFLLNGVDQ